MPQLFLEGFVHRALAVVLRRAVDKGEWEVDQQQPFPKRKVAAGCVRLVVCEQKKQVGRLEIDVAFVVRIAPGEGFTAGECRYPGRPVSYTVREMIEQESGAAGVT